MKYYHLTWAFPDAFHGNLGGILANLEIDLRHLENSFGGQGSHLGSLKGCLGYHSPFGASVRPYQISAILRWIFWATMIFRDFPISVFEAFKDV